MLKKLSSTFGSATSVPQDTKHKSGARRRGATALLATPAATPGPETEPVAVAVALAAARQPQHAQHYTHRKPAAEARATAVHIEHAQARAVAAPRIIVANAGGAGLAGLAPASARRASAAASTDTAAGSRLSKMNSNQSTISYNSTHSARSGTSGAGKRIGMSHYFSLREQRRAPRIVFCDYPDTQSPRTALLTT